MLEVAITKADIDSAFSKNYPRFIKTATAVTKNVALAADAVHSAYEKAATRCEQFRDEGSLAGWIGSIVHHEALKLHRMRKQEETKVAQYKVEYMDALEDRLKRENPESSYSNRAYVAAVLDCVPLRDRHSYIDFHVFNVNHRINGARNGLSHGAQRASFCRANKKIRTVQANVPPLQSNSPTFTYLQSIYSTVPPSESSMNYEVNEEVISRITDDEYEQLGAMNAAERQTYTLFQFFDITFFDAAKILGFSTKMIAQYLAQADKKVSEFLEGRRTVSSVQIRQAQRDVARVIDAYNIFTQPQRNI